MKFLFGACQKYSRITILIGKEFKLLGFLILGYNFILKHTINLHLVLVFDILIKHF